MLFYLIFEKRNTQHIDQNNQELSDEIFCQILSTISLDIAENAEEDDHLRRLTSKGFFLYEDGL